MAFDGRFGGDLLVQGDKVGVHDTAGGIVFEAHEVLDLVGPFFLHAIEQAAGGFIGKLIEQVGDVIVGHVFQNGHDFIRIHAVDEFDEEVLIQFAEENSLLLHIVDHIEQQSLILERQLRNRMERSAPWVFLTIL
jgi:hypothetical protein